MSIVNEEGFMDNIKKVVGDKVKNTAAEVKDRVLYAAGSNQALGRMDFRAALKKFNDDWNHYVGMNSKVKEIVPNVQNLVAFLKYDYNIGLDSDELKSFGTGTFDKDKVFPVIVNQLMHSGHMRVLRGKDIEKYKNPDKKDEKKGAEGDGTTAEKGKFEQNSAPEATSIFPNANGFFDGQKFKKLLVEKKFDTASLKAMNDTLNTISDPKELQDLLTNTAREKERNDKFTQISRFIVLFTQSVYTDEAEVEKDDKYTSRVANMKKSLNNSKITFNVVNFFLKFEDNANRLTATVIKNPADLVPYTRMLEALLVYFTIRKPNEEAKKPEEAPAAGEKK